MQVFLVDADRNPLYPCHPAVARKLLKTGKAAVLRRHPFVLIARNRYNAVDSKSLRVKIDPGSRTTGIAVLDDRFGKVIFAADVEHRGLAIKSSLQDRAALRRARRGRKTRYRKPRFDNRTRPKGWLPPSLESRVANVETWTKRLICFAPIGAISMELVRFDTHALQNPEISGVEYQQGTLFGYEVREYLLEKWNRKCAYCQKEDVPLQVEHMVSKDKGGSNRISNLCLACDACNKKKGNRTIQEFLKNKPELLKKLLVQAKTPLRDAAAVNSTRWALYGRLKELGLDVEVGTGGRTKFNRTTRGLLKEHWIDALCVGASTPDKISVENAQPLVIIAKGHGRRKRVTTDKFGFPKCHALRVKSFFGFKTGDIARATVSNGKNAGKHKGRVVVRRTGSFAIGDADGISWKKCHRVQRADGYSYAFRPLQRF